MAKISELEESKTLVGLYTVGSVPVTDPETGKTREETRKVSLEFIKDKTDDAVVQAAYAKEQGNYAKGIGDGLNARVTAVEERNTEQDQKLTELESEIGNQNKEVTASVNKIIQFAFAATTKVAFKVISDQSFSHFIYVRKEGTEDFVNYNSYQQFMNNQLHEIEVGYNITGIWIYFDSSVVGNPKATISVYTNLTLSVAENAKLISTVLPLQATKVVSQMGTYVLPFVWEDKIRVRYYIDYKNVVTPLSIKVGELYNVGIDYYADDDSIASTTGWVSEVLIPKKDSGQFRINFKKVDGGTITLDDIEENVEWSGYVIAELGNSKDEAYKSVEYALQTTLDNKMVLSDIIRTYNTFYQGNIISTGEINGSVNIRVTSELISSYPLRVVCKNGVKINIFHRYKTSELNEDFIEDRTAYNKEEAFIEVDNEYPFINITFHKGESASEIFSVQDAIDNILIYGGELLELKMEIEELADEVRYVEGNAEYYGEIQSIRIAENNHRMKSSLILEHTPNTCSDTVYNQSMSIYNGHYFCFNDTGFSTPFCTIIRMSDNAVVDTISEHPSVIGNSHVNNATFTDVFYDSNDLYPLILVSRGDYPDGTAKGKEMYIFRIQENSGKFTFTHIKTITTESYIFGASWEYDAARGMIWGHLCYGGDWRWGNSGYRKFDNVGLHFMPHNETSYICVESKQVALVDANITIGFEGSTWVEKSVAVKAGERLTGDKAVIPYTKNAGGYAYIRVNQSANAFTGQYDVYECDADGNNKSLIDYRCGIQGFNAPVLSSSESIVISEKEMTRPVKIDNVIFQGGCCFNGKLFLPCQNYKTINGQTPKYTGHCCFVINPLSGFIETQIPTDSMENEGCSIYDGALYISCHNGAAVGDDVSFKIFKYEL